MERVSGAEGLKFKHFQNVSFVEGNRRLVTCYFLCAHLSIASARSEKHPRSELALPRARVKVKGLVPLVNSFRFAQGAGWTDGEMDDERDALATRSEA